MRLDPDVLETSFDLVAPHGDALADRFYARLFEAAPEVRPLFAHVDMAAQHSMLLGALVLLRRHLRDLDTIVPTLHRLGARHVAYGVRAQHYPLVGEALISSMAEVAGDGWTNDYDHAWSAAFGVVAGAMLDGAELGIAA
jgi:hemoglobin-like flavoprotein